MPLLRRIGHTRVTVVTVILVLIICWVYLWRLSGGMATMAMDPQMGIRPWTLVDFWLMFLMWVVMMVGMMLPSATPLILTYERACAQDDKVATLLLALGYLVLWVPFCMVATLLQWGLEQAALLSPMMVSKSPFLGATLLLAAGVYQFTPFKQRCLSHCRTPLQFLTTRLRTGRLGAFRMGLEHGAFCLGCCWALMGLLFVGGVMNLLWIGLITLFVLAEKVLPYAVQGGRYVGGLMVLSGLYLLL